MIDLVVMCPDCLAKEMAGGSLSQCANDYCEYHTSIGLDFIGCEHLGVVSKERI